MRPVFTKRMRQAVAAENKRFPLLGLVEVGKKDWPEACSLMANPPKRAWRNRNYLVQLYDECGHQRLTVSTTHFSENRENHFADAIPWDTLQQLKTWAGFGTSCAIEIYPPDDHLINVANMRHLWIVDSPAFMWRRA